MAESTAGETAKGALGGAATGATIGTAILPGWGTAIGAVGGGLIGGVGGYLSGRSNNKPVAPKQYQDYNQMQALLRGAQGDPDAAYWSQDVTHYQAPQMQAAQAQAAQLQMGDDPFRRAQLQQLGQLQGIASGQQQGAAELGIQRQIQNALAAQQAQARMARGGNAALAYRNAANQSAALGISGAGMGQQAALQDQMAAQGMLGQLGATGRQGDYATANANAGYQQQAGLQNAGFLQDAAARNAAAQQQNQALNSSNYLKTIDQLSQMNAAQMQANQPVQKQPGFGSQLLGVGGQVLGGYLASR